jgi:quercetin dioxygenase-like cupin family protein
MKQSSRKLALSGCLAAIVFATLARSQDGSPSASSESDDRVARETVLEGPTETTGIETSVIGSVPLESYVATLGASNLRAREVVVAPGAKIAVHAHDERPAIARVPEGEIVEHRSDSETPLIRRRGDTYFEGPGVIHWVENVSSSPARVFTVDILPAAPE